MALVFELSYDTPVYVIVTYYLAIVSTSPSHIVLVLREQRPVLVVNYKDPPFDLLLPH
jgi:hypothetical protein